MFGTTPHHNGTEEVDYFQPELMVDHYSRTKQTAEREVREANGLGRDMDGDGQMEIN